MGDEIDVLRAELVRAALRCHSAAVRASRGSGAYRANVAALGRRAGADADEAAVLLAARDGLDVDQLLEWAAAVAHHRETLAVGPEPAYPTALLADERRLHLVVSA